MKLYTYLCEWNIEERRDNYKPIILDVNDIINISCFGYGKCSILLKDGRSLLCSRVTFVKDYPIYFEHNEAEELKCDSHEFYNKLIGIKS